MTFALLRRSVFVLVLVQVIFFDFEHRLILDRVMFPSMALALFVSLFSDPWWAGIATGLAAGLLFLLLALVGLGDLQGRGARVRRRQARRVHGPAAWAAADHPGALLRRGPGRGRSRSAIIVWHRSMKGTIAYGPYLAAGALIVLYLLQLA